MVCNRGYNVQYHGGLPSRELGQAPMLPVFLTPSQALSSTDGLTVLAHDLKSSSIVSSYLVGLQDPQQTRLGFFHPDKQLLPNLPVVGFEPPTFRKEG